MGERAVRPDALSRLTMAAMLTADVGFLAYWALVVGRVLPPEAMFDEYADPRVAAWNWSFLPLDLLASVTGILAVAAWRSRAPTAPTRLAVSLALTATAGGMAVAFWILRGQWNPWWMAPNLLLLAVPLPMVVRLVRRGTPGA